MHRHRAQLGLDSLTDEIMQQEVRPLVAADIIEQLHRQFAILSGGRGRDGAPIITFPECVGFQCIPEEDFLNVLTYLTSIPSVEAASIGFVIVIDRRRDKWSSIKASLLRIAVAFPGNLQLILILRPSHFLQRTFADLGIKYYRDEFKMKVPIIMLNSVSDLHGYIDKSQLTQELGGTLEYRHSQWLNHRTAIENFALTLKTTAQMLQMFGACLAATELPKGVLSSEDLLMSHTQQQDKVQDELKLLGKQGATLLSCVQEPATKNFSRKLNPSELENIATMERLLVQLGETEKAFSQFWFEHHLKLNQCLQLQHFEHNFGKVKLALHGLLEEQAELTGAGDSVMHVEQLLKEHRSLEEKGQEPLEKAQLLTLAGDQLIQSHHYAADSIRPKCAELRHLCDDFTNENKKKYNILGKSLELHRQLDKVSGWCEAGIYLLASQAVDKCQSREGIDVALNDIKTFLASAREYQLLSPKEFHNQFESLPTLDAKAKAQKVLQKLADVQEIFHKRQVSLMKLAAKQTRPVQPVAPHPESSPKWVSPKPSQPSSLAPPQRAAEGPRVETDLAAPEKEDGNESKLEVKNEESLQRSQDNGGSPVLERLGREDLSPSRRFMQDLLETEEIYIKEMKSIIDGYITPMDFIWLKHLIPDVLQNNKDCLFGNIKELYEFHNRTFLKELEKCVENPELLACCFLKRKEDLQMYFKYHKNLPRARAIWQECQDCAYFGVCQRQLDHSLPLFKYLGGPSQRLIKYQALLKGLLDRASPEDVEMDLGDLEGTSAKDVPKKTEEFQGSPAELQQALAVIEDLIKSCELAVDLAAVSGCPDDLEKLGRLLLHGPFSVWTIHKDRHKVKDFIRFKPSQRQIYLFEQGIVFCKIQVEPGDQGLSPHYSFKKSLKLVTLSIHRLGRGSNKKFEIASRNGLEKYILQAPSKEIRDCWFSAISKLLVEQNNIKDQENLQFEATIAKGSAVDCAPWSTERATSTEDPVSNTRGIQVILQCTHQMRVKAFPETSSRLPPPETSAASSTGGHATSPTAGETAENPTHTITTTSQTTESPPSSSPAKYTLATTLDNSHTAPPITEATIGPSSAPHSQPPQAPPTSTPRARPSTISHMTGKTTQPSVQTALSRTLSTAPHRSTTVQKPPPPTLSPGTPVTTHNATPTASPGLSTATHNATPTASPATTVPGATLVPQPSSAKTGTYQVLNGSRLCIKAQMGIELIVQETKSVFSPQRYFNIDPNATKASGNCGFRKSNLLLTFPGGSLNLTFTKEEISYYISEVGAYLTVSNPEKTFQGLKRAVMMFETVVGHSFKCVSEQSTQLSAQLRLKTMNVQLQAFDFEGDHFGNAAECFSDRNRREIPMAVGLSITGLLVILLMACLVAGKRPGRGYERM
ncbi:probable guanine nucleotide exchange factor MCF2L2 isoform X3 [Fukomys damarensis]|uniref:probable guanine nucleotide exchange factor MCF2L2 isoform X3 n=1 Tax=Fukomys damarensis TaxID=885580 RepID=UPI00053F86A0|nr:probable guanine nucleotide exchange factor MCF2L2 isoform X3 [Fukomys damarensis]